MIFFVRNFAPLKQLTVHRSKPQPALPLSWQPSRPHVYYQNKKNQKAYLKKRRSDVVGWVSQTQQAVVFRVVIIVSVGKGHLFKSETGGVTDLRIWESLEAKLEKMSKNFKIQRNFKQKLVKFVYI